MVRRDRWPLRQWRLLSATRSREGYSSGRRRIAPSVLRSGAWRIWYLRRWRARTSQRCKHNASASVDQVLRLASDGGAITLPRAMTLGTRAALMPGITIKFPEDVGAPCLSDGCLDLRHSVWRRRDVNGGAPGIGNSTTILVLLSSVLSRNVSLRLDLSSSLRACYK